MAKIFFQITAKTAFQQYAIISLSMSRYYEDPFINTFKDLDDFVQKKHDSLDVFSNISHQQIISGNYIKHNVTFEFNIDEEKFYGKSVQDYIREIFDKKLDEKKFYEKKDIPILRPK